MIYEEFKIAYKSLVDISRVDIDKAQKLGPNLETLWDPPLHILEDVVKNRFRTLNDQLTYGQQIEYYAKSLEFPDRYLKYHELLTENQQLAAKLMI